MVRARNKAFQPHLILSWSPRPRRLLFLLWLARTTWYCLWILEQVGMDEEKELHNCILHLRMPLWPPYATVRPKFCRMNPGKQNRVLWIRVMIGMFTVCLLQDCNIPSALADLWMPDIVWPWTMFDPMAYLYHSVHFCTFRFDFSQGEREWLPQPGEGDQGFAVDRLPGMGLGPQRDFEKNHGTATAVAPP